jgi:hypothetical protein
MKLVAGFRVRPAAVPEWRFRPITFMILIESVQITAIARAYFQQ